MPRDADGDGAAVVFGEGYGGFLGEVENAGGDWIVPSEAWLDLGIDQCLLALGERRDADFVVP